MSFFDKCQKADLEVRFCTSLRALNPCRTSIPLRMAAAKLVYWDYSRLTIVQWNPLPSFSVLCSPSVLFPHRLVYIVERLCAFEH